MSDAWDLWSQLYFKLSEVNQVVCTPQNSITFPPCHELLGISFLFFWEYLWTGWMKGGCCALAHACDDVGDASVRMTLPTPMKTLRKHIFSEV